MTRLRVCSFSVSLDGYGAGPDQSLEHPLGRGGLALHEWSHATRTFRGMFGQGGGSTGADEELLLASSATSAPGFDELHLALAPVLLGTREALFAGLDLPQLGYRCTEHVPTASATHIVLTRQAG